MGERDRLLVHERSDFYLWMKGNEWFCSCNSLLKYASFLVIVTWHFSIAIFVPFLVIVTWHVHIWNLSHFFGRFVQKVKISCFSASFVQKKTQQLNGSCNVTNDSQLSYKLFKKQPFYFCKHKWKLHCE